MVFRSLTAKVTSQQLVNLLKPTLSEMDIYYDVDIDGAEIIVESPDGGALMEVCETPDCLDYAFDGFLGLLEISLDEGDDGDKLKASIECMSWEMKKYGLDGDDGRFNIKNYDADVLSNLLEEIAYNYDCTPQDVTREMFLDWVAVEPDIPTEYATYSYSRETGKSEYYYTNSMREKRLETVEVLDPAQKKLRRPARILNPTIDAITEDQYQRVLADQKELLVSMSGKYSFSGRDEVTALLAQAFDRNPPYFRGNYYDFAAYLCDELNADVPIFYQDELIKIFEGKLEI